MRSAGALEPAAGLCRFCFVALCKPHLVELFQHPPAMPQLTCRHRPSSVPPVVGHQNGVAQPSQRPLRLATGAAPA